jgi:hypothetical protein
MSTEVAANTSGEDAATRPADRVQSPVADLRVMRILRYALGVTVTTAIAFSLAWPLFFLTPLLTAVFLAMPLPAPSVGAVLRDISYVFVAFLLGVVLTVLLLPFPLVFIPVLGLTLFRIYYLANRGGPPWLVLMSLLAVILLPMLGIEHDALAWGVAFYFVFSSAVAVVSVYLAHRLLPDPPVESRKPPTRSRRAGYSPAAAHTALTSTMAILPLAVLFIAMSLTEQLLVLVFAAIFSLAPDLAKSKAAGSKSLVSTLLGGAAALAVYWLIVAVPEIHFFVALMLLTALVFGAGIFSDGPLAKYLSSAATATIILLGSAMGEDVSIADEFVVRIVLTVLATLYVIAAVAVADRLTRPASSPAGA